jgi:hypothetical protein
VPNVYTMYVENGNRAGFWVQRNSWGKTCAFVRSVDGRDTGALHGKSPYYGNPPVIVDVFELATGECKDPGCLLSCPGTYAYRRIEPPPWSSQHDRTNEGAALVLSPQDLARRTTVA